MKSSVKKIIIFALAIVLIGTLIVTKNANAGSKNITIEQYLELLIKAMKVTVDETQEDPYVAAAIKAGLLEKENEFTYTKQMTRTECAVLTNRADIYLNVNEVTKLYDNIVNLKRISDLSKVTKKYRDDVVQAFGKGIIVGYTNGKCTQNREFRGSNKITYNGAKVVITKLINTKKRSVMSPDGQLTRSTKLPVNAKEFDYILASFPNSFYEMKFRYERLRSSDPFVLHNDYCPPIEMKNDVDYKRDVKLYEWCEVIKKNLNYRLNVNYKTIDNKWVKNLNSTLDSDKIGSINEYVKNIKKNRVVIKSSIISVEPSSLYLTDSYCIRVYVKFKITSASNIKNTIIFGDIYMPTLKMNKWHEGYYDIMLNGAYNGTGYDYKVWTLDLSDYFIQNKRKILKPSFNKKGDEDFPDGYYYFK
ncbi:hypothetical protein [Anaerosporobacter sp.]